MDLIVVPSSTLAGGLAQYSTSYIINGTIAVDAGCVGFHGTPRDQARIRHIFISHSHLDHVASLPILVENVYGPETAGLTIHGSHAVLESLRGDFFNNRVWPDMTVSVAGAPPFFQLAELRSGETVRAEGLNVTPIDVNHVVPTQGFLIDDGRASILIVSDTSPTEEIWRVANDRADLSAVFLEASFPNSLSSLADRTGHLTPSLVALEARKLHRATRLVIVHIKAAYYDEIAAELNALEMSHLELARFGVPYVF